MSCRYIDGLPIAASPEAFGLHQNADITRDQNDTALMFQSLASTSGGASGGGPGGGASEGLVGSLVRECLLALPPAFDLEAVQRKYPVLYEESMNTVLVQEMTRFNKLTGVIRDSLQSIDLALKVCDVVLDWQACYSAHLLLITVNPSAAVRGVDLQAEHSHVAVASMVFMDITVTVLLLG